MSATDAPDTKILRESVTTARAERPCSCCRAIIKAGERHLYIVMTVDGAFKAVRLCGAHGRRV